MKPKSKTWEMNGARVCVMAVLLLAALPIGAGEARGVWPFWDGSESIEQYARRAGLPATKSLDLGNGVTLDLVLIPAGRFVMGTPEPQRVDEEGFYAEIWTGVVALVAGGGLLLGLLCVVVMRAIRKRQRPQYSLAWFLAMALATGIGLLGGLHWHFSAQARADAQCEYEATLARFRSSYHGEMPAHEVTLTRPYYIGRYEVTQEQYREVTGSNLSYFGGRLLPVEGVSWHDAQDFCRKASEKTGFEVRLPTDAEWERACRAGTGTMYATGDTESDLDQTGWYDKNSKAVTHPVGQKMPNAWGAYDMHANVWEWCADWYTEVKQGETRDPVKGSLRVLRGGSWGDCSGYCRSASRFAEDPFEVYTHVGFRVVGEVSSTPEVVSVGGKP